MLPYVGIIQIRLMGRRSYLPSQPVIQAPLLFNCIYNTLILTKMQDKNATSLQLAHNFCFRDESFLHVPDRFCIQTQA